MFGIQSYQSFVAAVVVFQLIPGPGTLAILGATARHGRRAGFGAVAGTLVGDLLFMLAALAGLAAVMRANAALFDVLRWLGGAYLVYTGVQTMRARPEAAGATVETSSALMAFRRAFAVSLTNPKVLLFFVAFFPLFLAPNASGWTMAAMVAHVTGLSLAYQAGLMLVGNAAAQRLRGVPAVRTAAKRIGGAAMVGFGVKLALDDR